MVARLSVEQKLLVLAAAVAVLTTIATAQPIELQDERIIMNQGNITTVPWINPDAGENLSLGLI